MIIRVRYREVGAHVHVDVFAGEQLLSLGNCGRLTMRHSEFTTFAAMLGAAVHNDHSLGTVIIDRHDKREGMVLGQPLPQAEGVANDR